MVTGPTHCSTLLYSTLLIEITGHGTPNVNSADIYRNTLLASGTGLEHHTYELQVNVIKACVNMRIST